jgi:HEPN domain-containing protein
MKITSIDFADGLKTKNITVPPMLAEVELVNPPTELVDAVKKDKLIVQNIAVAVFKQLNESKGKIQAAILDFDATFKPSGNEKNDAERVKAFNSVCAQICQAQKGLAEAAAQKKWQEYVARNKAWTKYQIKFGCKIAAVTIGLSLSIATAAMTGGTTAIAVIGMAGKVYTLGKEIYEFAKDIATVEKTIVTIAAALSQRYSDPKLQKMDWKANAQEVAATLGVPFVKGTSTLKEELAKHKAKLGQLGRQAESAYEQAKGLMTKIAELQGLTKGTDKAQRADAIGRRVGALLDKVSSLNGKVEEGETFNETMDRMNEQFIAKREPKLGPLGKVVDYATEAQEVLGLAQEVLELAKAAAGA